MQIENDVAKSILAIESLGCRCGMGNEVILRSPVGPRERCLNPLVHDLPRWIRDEPQRILLNQLNW